ncbi:uncharacterized protein LOC124808959 isoform X2 [Hydra vulgaris]|uniref:uncharacterized protein LOC124808959 isoform X2 n=1 Tax=Hydra vulgaris TaxID=6087 RepID=UPI0032EA646F
MELNEHLSDMTKVYKRFGKKFSQKNKELNNDIHSRVAMNENEQMKMGSMLTGFMKVGLVSEAEKFSFLVVIEVQLGKLQNTSNSVIKI